VSPRITALSAAGFGARALEAGGGHRVDERVHALDARDARFEQIDGRDGLAADEPAQFDGGFLDELRAGGRGCVVQVHQSAVMFARAATARIRGSSRLMSSLDAAALL
jgi:hypothetical protein